MPIAGVTQLPSEPNPYFTSLEDLDNWNNNVPKKLDAILPYTDRPTPINPQSHGKLLVCHDYKGGYTESPFSPCYTFNFWQYCETFVYFSHQRVTVPPPGWITAAHRQGTKILGVLIFEGGAESECLRLLVGKLPKSHTGPAQSRTHHNLPISDHYARLLADLAVQRGFDGYLLNFETGLQGQYEQTRALTAWVNLLRSEIQHKVGSHGQVVWYDSVIITGQLAWQNRLNSLNLPFLLSSSLFFSNYFSKPETPELSAQYFLSLDPSLAEKTSVPSLSLNSTYMGIDIWGRGSYGGGGFGAYKALTQIAPDSLGLSVAIFGQAWTWESEQDKPGWNWDQWWEYERGLWIGTQKQLSTPSSGETKSSNGSLGELTKAPYKPIVSFFPRLPPPDPLSLPLHTTFSPGVGWKWFVEGVEVFHTESGWCDIDKQCSLGDQVWPSPTVLWEAADAINLPKASSEVCMDTAWNGGSSLRIKFSDDVLDESDSFRCIWVPIQSVTVTQSTSYDAIVVYKLEDHTYTDVDISFSIKTPPQKTLDDLQNPDTLDVECSPITLASSDLPNGWTRLGIRFKASVPGNQETSLGFIISILTEDTSEISTKPSASLLVGQLNVYPTIDLESSITTPLIIWADFQSAAVAAPEARAEQALPASDDDAITATVVTNLTPSGTLTWDTAVTFPTLGPITITSPEDPISAWPLPPHSNWFPKFLYFNVYAMRFQKRDGGVVVGPKDAVWIGTTGWSGRKNTFVVVGENLEAQVPKSEPVPSKSNNSNNTTIPAGGGGEREGKSKDVWRFYVQGVTDHGETLEWDRCVFVEV